MEVASSRPDYLPTLSAAETSKLFLLVKHHIMAVYGGKLTTTTTSIPQWNANGIHTELPLLEDLLEPATVDVVLSKKQNCSQKTRHLTSETSVLSDVIDQRKQKSKGKREGEVRGGSERGKPYDVHSKIDSSESQPLTGQQLKRNGEDVDQDSNPK